MCLTLSRQEGAKIRLPRAEESDRRRTVHRKEAEYSSREKRVSQVEDLLHQVSAMSTSSDTRVQDLLRSARLLRKAGQITTHHHSLSGPTFRHLKSLLFFLFALLRATASIAAEVVSSLPTRSYNWAGHNLRRSIRWPSMVRCTTRAG